MKHDLRPKNRSALLSERAPPRRATQLLLLSIIMVALLVGARATPMIAKAAPANPRTTTTRAMPFGFGMAVAAHDGEHVRNLEFNWMLMYDIPNQREPVNVLYRVPVNHWSGGQVNDDSQRQQFIQELTQLAAERGKWIEAYEIGNEVNLYVNGWEAPPDAAAYAELLCTAYYTIKFQDPTALIISAGLAPVGRVEGNWQGHAGHNYLVQDEREYLQELLDAGGGGCIDAFGYHGLGFSANFDADPDVDGGKPETNCANGFCFRGIEQIRAIIAASDYADTPLWATEVGWLAEPTDAACLDDYSWAGRAWQRVTRQKQTENIVGAYKHAYTEWPWLGAMFLFNLNFDQAPYYHPCEQMRYYSIQGTASELALREMIGEVLSIIQLPAVGK